MMASVEGDGNFAIIFVKRSRGFQICKHTQTEILTFISGNIIVIQLKISKTKQKY